MHSRITMPLAAALLLLAACAPADLDITPSPAPTAVPVVAPTLDAAAQAETTETISPELAALDAILAAVPPRIDAGAIQWQLQSDTPEYRDIDGGGVQGQLDFSERQGGQSTISFVIFPTAEAARAHYDTVRGQLRTLERSTERDNFPLPNAFGGGTYGSDAIFAIGPMFMRISVPRFSSTSGDPLPAYARQLLEIVEQAAPEIIAQAQTGG